MISTKFKIGDFVEIIGNINGSCNEVGEIGTVTGIFGEDSYRVQVPGRKNFGNITRREDIKEYNSQYEIY